MGFWSPKSHSPSPFLFLFLSHSLVLSHSLLMESDWVTVTTTASDQEPSTRSSSSTTTVPESLPFFLFPFPPFFFPFESAFLFPSHPPSQTHLPQPWRNQEKQQQQAHPSQSCSTSSTTASPSRTHLISSLFCLVFWSHPFLLPPSTLPETSCLPT